MINMPKISRRSLLLGLTAVGTGTIARATTRPVRVAALQIHPKLADVGANLERAERLIRDAISARATGSSCRSSSRPASPSIRRRSGLSSLVPNRFDEFLVNRSCAFDRLPGSADASNILERSFVRAM